MSDNLKIQIVGTLNAGLTIGEINTAIKGIEKKIQAVKLKVEVDEKFTSTLDNFRKSMDKFKNVSESLNKSFKEEETIVKSLDGTIEKINRKYLKSGDIIQKTTKIIDEKKKAIDAETLAIKEQTNALERQGKVQKEVTRTDAIGRQTGKSVTNKIDPNTSTTYNYDKNQGLKSTVTTTNYAQQEKQIEGLQKALSNLYNQGKVNEDFFNRFGNAINNAKNIQEVQKLSNELNKQTQIAKNQEMQQKLLSQADTLGRTHSKTVKHDELEQIKNTLSGIVPSANNSANALANTSVALNRVRDNAKEAARSSMALGDMLEQAFTKFPIWMVASTAFFLPIQGIQDMTTRVIELDTQMTNLKRVMDGEDFQFNNLLEDSIELTDRLSGRLTDVLKLVEEFGRMGNSMDESLDLAETAQILQNISDLDAKQSVDALTSAMINFGIAAEDSIQIADKLNEVNL